MHILFIFRIYPIVLFNMTSTNTADYFDFDNLVPELRIEVIKYLDIQTLGRFIQTNRSAAGHISKDDWKRKIHELDPTIWPKLSKRTRKGDPKLLCAIVREGLVSFYRFKSFPR